MHRVTWTASEASKYYVKWNFDRWHHPVTAAGTDNEFSNSTLNAS